MATQSSKTISGPMKSSSYDPNAFSIFPDLLQPAGVQTAISATFVIFEGVVVEYLLSVRHAFTWALHPEDVTPASPPIRPSAEGRQQHPLAFLEHECSNIWKQPAGNAAATTSGENKPIPPPADEKEADDQPSSPKRRKMNTNCPICLSPFNMPTSTNCGHVFCKECIDRAIALKKECPVCRKKTTMRNLFRVYFS